MSLPTSNNNLSFLQHSGEMGGLMRNYNWEQTSIGLPRQWPQSLRTAISILLHSRFPMFLIWGHDHLCFYNDAYRALLGQTTQHPHMLGAKLPEAWPESWEALKPRITSLLAGAEATLAEDENIPLQRNGQLQDAWWTYSFSAVYDESGQPGGVFITCIETTSSRKNLTAVQEINDRLQFAIEANELATFDYNPLTNVLTSNNRLKEWFGLPVDAEIDLSKAVATIADEDRARVEELIRNAIKPNSSGRYNTQYAIVNPHNGTRRIVRAKGKAWFNENQQAYRLNGTLQDITEEVNSRIRLEESESYFRQLTDTVPALIWITAADGYCTYLNANWYKYTGQTKEEAEGFGWMEAIHPDDYERTEATFVTANNKKENFSVSYRLRNNQGLYRWVLDCGSPRHSSEGVYEGMIGTVVDIHEQKVAEEKVKRSEARFRSLIAAAPVAISLFVGRDLVIENPNQTFIKIVGKGDSIVGKPLRDAMPELVSEGQPFLKILDDVYTSGVPFQTFGTQVKIMQLGVLTHNYYDFSYTPLLDDEGKVFAILDIAIDVTEQVLARQKVEEAEERTRLAVEAAEMGMYEIDLDTQAVISNPRFNEIFGVTNDTNHSAYIDAIHPDDRPLRTKAHAQAYETGSMLYEARVLHKNEAVHWVRVKGKVDYNDEHKPVRLLGVVQDVTEQKELEKQKDNFLGIASHELKTPVTSMKAYAQLMERVFQRNGDIKSAELVAKMNNQTDRLSSLIADLLDVTKINNGRLQFNNMLFDFNDLVSEVIEDVERTSPNHSIIKKLDFTGQVLGDKERVSQVIVNLVNNAIKYSPGTKHIVVYTQNKGTEVQLCVQDFGIGISPDKRERVFEQFYRVSGTKEHTFPGLGLGLYISSEIVKRMNGRIWVNSVEGQGSTFCFSIPVQQK